MTNAHVVDGADEVLVTLTDKREFKARIVGADKRTDVAVVKIDATGLPFVKIGDVNRLKVGEWVMAIGSPFGLENTVTAGIVSAKQRDTGDYLPFIQTDVAINPGNSGGPLLNLRGEVVGINSQIYSRSGGFMGIAFAIPIDEAMRVSDQLRTSGRVIRGRIGVQIAPVTKEVAESIGLGKPAARWCRASRPAARPTRPASRPATSSPRSTARRSRSRATCRASSAAPSPAPRRRCRCSAAAAPRTSASRWPSSRPTAAERRAGAQPGHAARRPRACWASSVADLTDAQKRELHLRGGVRVEAVDGAAARAGLREGDVILSMDNTEITDVKQFASVAPKAEKAARA